jgi:hypothetical protein
VIERIEDLAVLEETEVQVGGGVSDSGPAHLANTFTGVHLIADLHVVASEMGVERHEAVAVVDFHIQSTRPHVPFMND